MKHSRVQHASTRAAKEMEQEVNSSPPLRAPSTEQPEHYRLLGFTCAQAADKTAGQSDLQKAIAQQQQMITDLDNQYKLHRNVLDAIHLEEKNEQDKLLIADRALIDEVLGRIPGLKTGIVDLKRELEQLRKTENLLLEQLAGARSKIVASAIEHTASDTKLLITKQEELHRQRQKILDAEYGRHSAAHLARATYFKKAAEEAEVYRKRILAWARTMGLSLTSKRLAPSLLTLASSLGILAGILFARIEPDADYGAQKIIEYVLGRSIVQVENVIGGYGNWVGMLYLLGIWVGMLALIHLVIWLSHRALRAMNVRVTTKRLPVQIGDETLDLPIVNSRTGGLLARWYQVLPWLFIAGLVLIIVGDTTSFEKNTRHLANQAIGVAISVLLGIVFYVLIARAAPEKPRAARIIRGIWLVLLAASFVVACAALLNLQVGTFPVPDEVRALFLLCSLTAAYCLGMAMILIDAQAALDDLERRILNLTNLYAFSSKPRSAGLIGYEPESIRGRLDEVWEVLFGAIKDRTARTDPNSKERRAKRDQQRRKKEETQENGVLDRLIRNFFNQGDRTPPDEPIISIEVPLDDQELFPELFQQIANVGRDYSSMAEELRSTEKEVTEIQQGTHTMIKETIERIKLRTEELVVSCKAHDERLQQRSNEYEAQRRTHAANIVLLNTGYLLGTAYSAQN